MNYLVYTNKFRLEMESKKGNVLSPFMYLCENWPTSTKWSEIGDVSMEVAKSLIFFLGGGDKDALNIDLNKQILL